MLGHYRGDNNFNMRKNCSIYEHSFSQTCDINIYHHSTEFITKYEKKLRDKYTHTYEAVRETILSKKCKIPQMIQTDLLVK